MKRNEFRAAKSRKVISKKRLALLLSMILIFTCVVGGTLAYLFTMAGPITDTFEPAEVSCSVSDNLTQVTNSSETSVWLRVSITAVYRSTDPNQLDAIHWENPTLVITNADSWTKVGDFYYYNVAVSAQGTVNLPTITATGEVAGFKIEKQVLAEVIQSAPLNAVQEAWKMTRVGENWQAYP